MEPQLLRTLIPELLAFMGHVVFVTQLRTDVVTDRRILTRSPVAVLPWGGILPQIVRYFCSSLD